MFCEYLKQLAKAKKMWHLSLAGKIQIILGAKFTYFLCIHEGQT
jgi:hypothetical protein